LFKFNRALLSAFVRKVSESMQVPGQLARIFPDLGLRPQNAFGNFPDESRELINILSGGQLGAYGNSARGNSGMQGSARIVSLRKAQAAA
jgi:hypothetical protein